MQILEQVKTISTKKFQMEYSQFFPAIWIL